MMNVAGAEKDAKEVFTTAWHRAVERWKNVCAPPSMEVSTGSHCNARACCGSTMDTVCTWQFPCITQ
eukprot:391188-Pelagomonas_calceolata.AAC.5